MKISSPKLLPFTLVLVLFTGASAAQLHQIAIVDIPGRPGFDSVALAGGQVVIAHRGANTVDVFDPARRRLRKQISGMADPRGIAVDDAAARLYVANAGNNSIAIINSKSWELERSIPLRHSPDTLLLTAGKLYIGNWNHASISVVDLGSNSALATIPLAGRPENMVADPQTGLVFANVEDQNEVVAIDSQHRLVKRYKLAASQPTGIALDPKFRRLFVAVRYAVLMLDADSGQELGRVPAAAGADTLWFDPANGNLYAAASDGSVNMISTQKSFTSEHELKTDVRGHTLVFDPARKLLYLPGGREGRSKVVILQRVETPGASAPALAGSPAKPAITAEKN